MVSVISANVSHKDDGDVELKVVLNMNETMAKSFVGKDAKITANGEVVTVEILCGHEDIEQHQEAAQTKAQDEAAKAETTRRANLGLPPLETNSAT